MSELRRVCCDQLGEGITSGIRVVDRNRNRCVTSGAECEGQGTRTGTHISLPDVVSEADAHKTRYLSQVYNRLVKITPSGGSALTLEECVQVVLEIRKKQKGGYFSD
ncbi:hypothetical protein JZ785_27510 (plasmid) [Alicyclobacillus curvatus]|nr:hypothetical protein JZ785_27510 [Alicyclobacillus curvatus]